MKIISPANKTVIQMLRNFQKPATSYRKLSYIIDTEVDDGILLFNLFTRELVLLSKYEYDNAIDNEYLRKQWFIVPEDCQEKEYVDLIRTLIKTRTKHLEEITHYTIFTTTDCNARCFYCFEAGKPKITMSHKISEKIVTYIKKHCNNKKVTIRWFGGEPLMNQNAINTICNGLRNNAIEYESSLVTNGYLFDANAVQDAVNSWNLKNVQITLDGTEKVYNKVKSYIYSNGNPFEIVLNNIQELLNNKILVTVRLNMDLYNAEDLYVLVEYLCDRFKGYDNLFIYAHHLFDANKPDAELHSPEDWALRAKAMAKINHLIMTNNFTLKRSISSKIKTYHCMADSGHSITILPDGNIGLCEHHIDDNYIGHIDNDYFDNAIIESFKKTTPETPKCATCFYFPDCIMLTKCNTSSKCYPQFINKMAEKTKNQMINKYRNSKNQ